MLQFEALHAKNVWYEVDAQCPSTFYLEKLNRKNKNVICYVRHMFGIMHKYSNTTLQIVKITSVCNNLQKKFIALFSQNSNYKKCVVSFTVNRTLHFTGDMNS